MCTKLRQSQNVCQIPILLEMDDFEGFTDCNETDHSLTSKTSNTL